MTDPAPEPQPQPTEPPTPEPTEPPTPEPTPGPETNPPTEEELEGEPPEAQPPAGEPPPAEPLAATKTEEEWEQIGKKLDKSATTWRNRVSELLGESAQDLIVCELCDPTMPGFHFAPDITQPRDEIHGRLLQVLLTPEGPEYEVDATKPACDKCKGLGSVRTGSKVPTQAVLSCPACQGKGWISPGQMAQNGPPTEAPVLVQVGAPEEQAPQEDVDPWRSPRLLENGMENPNYGKMPQYKSPDFP